MLKGGVLTSLQVGDPTACHRHPLVHLHIPLFEPFTCFPDLPALNAADKNQLRISER